MIDGDGSFIATTWPHDTRGCCSRPTTRANASFRAGTPGLGGTSAQNVKYTYRIEPGLFCMPPKSCQHIGAFVLLDAYTYERVLFVHRQRGHEEEDRSRCRSMTLGKGVTEVVLDNTDRLTRLNDVPNLR